MSIIVPAGNKMVDWTKSEQEMVKTASVDNKDEKSEEKSSDALYEAAKSFFEAQKKEEVKTEKTAGIIPGVPDGTGPHGTGPEKGRGMGPCGKGGSDGQGDIDAKVDTEEVVVEPVAEEKQEADKMEEAVEKIEEGVNDIKEVVQEEKGELEGTGEEVDVVEIDIEEDDVPGEEVKDGEVIVEGKKEEEKTEEKTEDGITRANTEEQFCKFAKISEPNRKKLVKYWTALGFPPDYVALMTKN